MAETVLSIDNLCVTYKNKRKQVYAVKNASFAIEKGDALGIVGESGSGKSTLAMALLRLLSERTAIVSGKADFWAATLLPWAIRSCPSCVGKSWPSFFRRP